MIEYSITVVWACIIWMTQSWKDLMYRRRDFNMILSEVAKGQLFPMNTIENICNYPGLLKNYNRHAATYDPTPKQRIAFFIYTNLSVNSAWSVLNGNKRIQTDWMTRQLVKNLVIND